MLDIHQINELQYENTKLREFTQWVLEQWEEESEVNNAD